MQPPLDPQPPSDLPLDAEGIRRRGVVAVVVRGAEFLVIRRSSTVAAPRKFCFPGGGIEGAESEPEALVREFQEELGARVRPVRCVWRSVTRWRVSLAWWLAELDAGTPLVANPDEVESVHWLSVGAMRREAELLESNQLFLDELAAARIRLD